MAFDFAHYVALRTALIKDGLDKWTPPETVPPQSLHAAMRYSLLGGSSKFLRPLLCIAGAEAANGNAQMVLPTACALEMIHTFSLIHDDLPAIDNDDFRRGMPTSHKKFGESMAILAGDALNTLAFSTVADYQTGNPAVIVRVLSLLAQASGTSGMVGGQVDDIYYERRPVTAQILQSIHERKTGALLNASILSGALLSGANETELSALRTYGDCVGLAFQIVDDILDVTGDDAKIGKPTGSDEKNDKATYPKLFGLAESGRLAREAATRASDALSNFGTCAQPLRSFAHFIVEREM